MGAITLGNKNIRICYLSDNTIHYIYLGEIMIYRLLHGANLIDADGKNFIDANGDQILVN